jgi:hypothetical protein
MFSFSLCDQFDEDNLAGLWSPKKGIFCFTFFFAYCYQIVPVQRYHIELHLLYLINLSDIFDFLQS